MTGLGLERFESHAGLAEPSENPRTSLRRNPASSIASIIARSREVRSAANSAVTSPVSKI